MKYQKKIKRIRQDLSVEKNIAEDPDYKLWVLLHQARDAMHKVRDREVVKYGLTAVQSAILFVVTANGGETTSFTISNWLIREPHTISNILTRMESQGLVIKVKNPHKNNELVISATEKGQKAFSKATNMALIHAILSCLSKAERKQLSSSLKKVRDKALTHLITLRSVPYP